MPRHLDRINQAIAEKRCFACANFCEPFVRLNGACFAGGLDPAATAAAGSDYLKRNACRMVSAFNRCPRFTLAQQVAA